MRVLIVTGTFDPSGANAWLMDDLATALTAAGHRVDVLLHDARRGHPRGVIHTDDPSLRVLSVGPRGDSGTGVVRILRHLDAWVGLRFRAGRLLSREPYDLAITASIGALAWGLPGRLRRTGRARRLVFVLWDFFPVHQFEIGRLRRGWAASLLRRLERNAIAAADVVAVMSPANERFLRAYHPSIGTPAVVVPPWSSSGDAVATVAKQPLFTAIFGGQLTRGRGIDTLLDAAAHLQRAGEPIGILIAGDGPDGPALRAEADRLGLANVRFLGRLERDAYRALLPSVHVGIAVTVAGVSPPTFPSKIAEYCGAGIPALVCVEASSDAGAFVENAGAGVAVPAGDPERLAAALVGMRREHLAGTLESRAVAARRLYDESLSAGAAARAIVDAASGIGRV